MNRNRRNFLKKVSIASASALSMPSIMSCRSSPNDLIHIGMIGVGIHGMTYNLKHYLKYNKLCRVVAVCDVQSGLMKKAKKMVDKAYGNNDCKMYEDFRALIADNDIDAVQISTPDHWHVPISVIAANNGKHVMCEKPTHTIEEGQMLVAVIRKTGVKYAVSVEDRFLPRYHKLAEIVRNGRIGALKDIYIELPVRKVPTDGFEIVDPPKHLNYELWSGPAPLLPYCKSRVNYNWRWNKHYGGGTITDWLPHQGETALWVLDYDFKHPISVKPLKNTVFHSGIYNTPKEFDVQYTFPNKVNMRVVNGIPLIRFIGTEGWVEIRGWNKEITASDPNVINMQDQKVFLPTDLDEFHNFLQGIKHDVTPTMTAERSHQTSTLCHLGNITSDLNMELEWDPVNEKFADSAEANSKLGKIPREEWSYERIINMVC
ncbi:MAG: Gfo/Idh/MocA family oxidoreductase [Cytophagales bacterium]|nr:Gfo/Idh/MocA family oxidoreductase [Cytophagales bacterium]